MVDAATIVPIVLEQRRKAMPTKLCWWRHHRQSWGKAPIKMLVANRLSQGMTDIASWRSRVSFLPFELNSSSTLAIKFNVLHRILLVLVTLFSSSCQHRVASGWATVALSATYRNIIAIGYMAVGKHSRKDKRNEDTFLHNLLLRRLIDSSAPQWKPLSENPKP